MIRFIVFFMLMASPASAAGNWCSGSGQGCVDCPRHTKGCRPVHAVIEMKREPLCTGWTDPNTFECHHGIGGSGMGPHGYVGRCGAGNCNQDDGDKK